MPLVRESLRHDADLKLCILPVEVFRHDALSQKLEASHFGLHPTSSVISGQFLPVGPAEASAGVQGLIAGLQAGILSLPVPGIPAGQDNGICTSGRDSDVTTLGITDAIGGDAADLFLRRDLCQQIRQYPSPVRSNRWRFTGSTSPRTLSRCCPPADAAARTPNDMGSAFCRRQSLV